MRTLMAAVVGVAACAAAGAQDKAAAPFQGGWVVLWVTGEGRGDEGLRGGTGVQEGNKYPVNPPVGSSVPKVAGTFSVDASKTPAHFDMKPEGGRYAGKTLSG